MPSELLAGLSIFKTLYDSAKALKDINDAAVRGAAVVELLEKLLSAREAQQGLLSRISELEKEVARFHTWEAEKQRYELKRIAFGAFAYALKPDAQPSEPPHWLCTQCYGEAKKALLQCAGMSGFQYLWQCPRCSARILVPESSQP